MKLIKENFDKSVERERRIASLKNKMVSENLIDEEKEEETKVYKVTYKVSDNIFSSFMIKANSAEDATEKANKYVKKKYGDDKEVFGATEMSDSDVQEYKRRGMSLVEDVSVVEKKPACDCKKVKSTIRESADKDKIKKDVEELSTHPFDVLIYKTADKDLPKLYVKRNYDYPEYYMLWNKDTNDDFANVVKFSSLDNAVYWIMHTAASYEPERLVDKYRGIEEGKTVCENMEEGEEVPASPESDTTISIANMLNLLIQDEWQAISGYNDTIASLRSIKDIPEQSEPIDFDGMIKILEDISAEENNHVGMLQKAMQTISPNVSEIKGGEEEAEETLEEPAELPEE